MKINKLKNNFIIYCKEKKFEINHDQIKIIDKLVEFYSSKNFLRSIFLKKSSKLGFYLHGDVGVGKTMILNFFFDYINTKKKRIHFNEFMINYHDFSHTNKNKKRNVIEDFVKKVKKNYKLIYFDEFQVTNIVDAMILGKLFSRIFEEGIKIIISSNTQINNLYKDGLQREQFLPFISVIKKFSIEAKLTIKSDYRKKGINKLKRYLYPLNESTFFKFNQFIHKFTKGKKMETKKITVKGRDFQIKNFFEGLAIFSFRELCAKNLGSEDYIKISEVCHFVVIENIPIFTDENTDKQQRFISLIDIFYEKKIPLMLSSNASLEKLSSSKKLDQPFKRTISRIFELTSPNFRI